MRHPPPVHVPDAPLLIHEPHVSPTCEDPPLCQSDPSRPPKMHITAAMIAELYAFAADPAVLEDIRSFAREDGVPEAKPQKQ